MLGNSRWKPFAVVAFAGAVLVLAGCARNVKQDSHTGEDGKIGGAKTLELEEGEGRARDIVTYPGGDRIDWKMIELPEGKKGKLEIKLKFRTPRPRLDLAFRVYDGYGHPVERAKPDESGRKTTKRVKIRGAEGKYYVQVFAPRRKDAGRYTLSVRFKERPQVVQVDPADLIGEIDDPPKLPAVPEQEEPEGDDDDDDKADDDDDDDDDKADDDDDDDDDNGDDDDDGITEPIQGTVTNVQLASSGVILTINRGSSAGVERGWSGSVLKGNTDQFLSGGDFKVIKVTKSESVAKVRLSIDQIRSNRRVLLTPPAP